MNKNNSKNITLTNELRSEIRGMIYDLNGGQGQRLKHFNDTAKTTGLSAQGLFGLYHDENRKIIRKRTYSKIKKAWNDLREGRGYDETIGDILDVELYDECLTGDEVTKTMIVTDSDSYVATKGNESHEGIDWDTDWDGPIPEEDFNEEGEQDQTVIIQGLRDMVEEFNKAVEALGKASIRIWIERDYSKDKDQYSVIAEKTVRL